MKNRWFFRLISSVVLVLSLSCLTGCGTGEGDMGKIVIFNYGDYINPEVISMFEDETGYSVVVEEYNDPETMYAKFDAGAVDYDLICTADYMIEKMSNAGKLLEINYDNLEYKDNIGDTYWEYSKAFDHDLKYTVPYFWGTVGILYNTTMVDEKDVKSWNCLFNDKYKGQIIMPNSVRDCFIIPLILNGSSINTTDPAQLKAAEDMLLKQKGLVQAYYNDEARDQVISENTAMAVIYSSESYIAIESNEDLAFYTPDEGSNLWFDSWCIPNTCKNKEGAEAFLNFLCREDVAALNFEYNYSATPNEAVLSNLDDEMRADSNIFISDEVLNKCEVYTSLDDETYSLYSKMWKEIKAQ